MSIAKTSIFFAIGTFLSRITGFLREREIGAIFGASALDVYNVAFRIPNLFRDMLAEGTLSAAFTKVYTSTSVDDRIKAEQLLIEFLYFVTLLATVVSALGIFAAPLFVKLMTLGGLETTRGQDFVQECVKLTRILFPYLGLTMLSAVTMGALHKHGKMFISACSPIFFNLSIIFGAVVLSDYFAYSAPGWLRGYYQNPALIGLVVGVLIGGLLQILVQLLGLIKPIKTGISSKTKVRLWSTESKQILLLMAPMIIATSSTQINSLVNTNFALTLENGSVTWLMFAFRILHLPVALFGVAISVSLLPPLTRAIKTSHHVITDKISRNFQTVLEVVCWLMLPSMLFLQDNADAVVNVIFGKGKFIGKDVSNTALALYAYGFGLVGYGLIKVLTPFYFAIGKTSYAMKVSIFCSIVNFAANFFLVKRFGFQGLAYTLAIVVTTNAALLLWGSIKNGVKFDRSMTIKGLVFLLAGFVVCSLFQAYSTGLVQQTLGGSQLKKDFVQVLLNGSLVSVVFIVLGFWRFQVSPSKLLKRR